MRSTIKDKEIRDNFNAEYAKLADLEDIEDKLGIEILTLLDMQSHGNFYVKLESGEIEKTNKKGSYLFYYA